MSQEFPTAEQARESMKSLEKTSFDLCKKQILIAIARGEKIIYCEPSLTHSEINFFRTRGYNIIYEPDYVLGRQFNKYKISW